MMRVLMRAMCAVAITGWATGQPFDGGMVAADHPLAAEAGAAVLGLGGNAVDAAVATSFALSVVRPDACGIGGGGFMLVHLADDPRHGTCSVAINYRETCPAAIGPASYSAWNDPDASRIGGRAVAVPGTVAGLLQALENYGSLPRADVMAPAIHLAENGFPADEHHVRTAGRLVQFFHTKPHARTRFPLVWDRLMGAGELSVGDQIHLLEQAAALRLIAAEGADAFYQGAIGEAIVASVADAGGVLTREDLLKYRVRETEPIVHELDGSRVLAMPPPSSGGVAIAQILSLAEAVELDVPATGWLDDESAHLLAEIMKHAFADRSRHMADPAFVDVPTDRMLNPDALASTVDAIDREQAQPPEAYGLVVPLPEDGGTSHISVIDRHGNAVACTETINLAFGSLVGVDGFGFCLNNQMDDFTTVSGQANAFGLVQSDANLPEPGKRPLSSMSPTIVLDDTGNVIAVAGGSGGPQIISATAQVLLRMLRGDATAKEATRAPRLHHQWLPDRLYFERTDDVSPPADLVNNLRAAGHSVATRAEIGAVQALRRDPADGAIDGAADRRKGGAAVGP